MRAPRATSVRNHLVTASTSKTKARHASPGEPQLKLGMMLDLASATFVVIHDAWSGHALDAPHLRSYQLERTRGGGLQGPATFSTSLVPPERVDIRLTPKLAGELLGALGEVKLYPGPPPTDGMDHTDDYPHIEIAVYVPGDQREGGILLMVSSAQTEARVPWTITLGHRVWWTDSKRIAKALRAHRAALRWGVLERLVGEGVRGAARRRE